jgi:hypothetical protein
MYTLATYLAERTAKPMATRLRLHSKLKLDVQKRHMVLPGQQCGQSVQNAQLLCSPTFVICSQLWPLVVWGFWRFG